MAVPGVQNNQGMLHPDFRSKFPLGTIPAIEDTDNGLKLSESTAILTYLAEKHGWQDIYPPDAAIRAKVNEYMGGTIAAREAYTQVFLRPRFAWTSSTTLPLYLLPTALPSTASASSTPSFSEMGHLSLG
jgi:glutathione S-transferase